MKMLLKYFHEFKNKVVLDQKTLLHYKNAIYEVSHWVSMRCRLVNRKLLVEIAGNSTVTVILVSISKYIGWLCFGTNEYYRLNNYSF